MNHHRQSQEDPLHMSDLQAHYDKAGFHLLQLLIDLHTVSCSAEVFDRSCRGGTLTGSYRINARIDLQRSSSLAVAQSSICCTSLPTARAFAKRVHLDSDTLHLRSIPFDLQIAQATWKIQSYVMLLKLLKPFLSMVRMAVPIFTHGLLATFIMHCTIWCTSRAAPSFVLQLRDCQIHRCMCLALLALK